MAVASWSATKKYRGYRSTLHHCINSSTRCFVSSSMFRHLLGRFVGAAKVSRPFSSGSSSGGNQTLWDKYSLLLEKHPLRTKVDSTLFFFKSSVLCIIPYVSYIIPAITSGFICGSGDLLCQSSSFDESHSGGVDTKRLGIFVLLGSALLAPTLHVW